MKSDIIYFSRDFELCGYKTIERPDMKYLWDRRDSKMVMEIGMKAYDAGEFELVPRYWVTYNGEQKLLNEYTVNNPRIKWLINRRFLFSSVFNLGKKIKRIHYLLSIGDALSTGFFDNPDRFDETVTLGIPNIGDDFGLPRLLQLLHNGIENCTESIIYVKKCIRDIRKRSSRIENVLYKGINLPGLSYNETMDLLIKPARKTFANELHDLKHRLNTLERKRSWMGELMKLIMITTWR